RSPSNLHPSKLIEGRFCAHAAIDLGHRGVAI
ncbi:MAG: hypothetical protein ACI8PT_001719, partial [Gammaproteobacteria bacterium]